MDLESAQFLNLSPIPEMSEVELSAMLEQLSNLSDLNCELSDRNVEDLLKEAEILIDESSNNNLKESKILKDNVKFSKVLGKQNEDSINLKLNEELKQEIDNFSIFNETVTDESNKYPKNNVSPKFSGTKPEISEIPFVEKFSKSILPADSTINHIKSTIDSLREYSNMIEKKKSQCRNSPKSQDSNDIKAEIQAIETADIEAPKEKNDFSDESKTSQDLCTYSPKRNNSLDEKEKKPVKELCEPHNLGKSEKTLSCFERLYQGKPVKLSLNQKKTKFFNKEQKTLKNNSGTKNLKNPTTSYIEKKNLCNKGSTKGTTKKSNNKLEKKQNQSLNHIDSVPLIFSSDEMELEDWCKEQFNSNANFDSKKEEVFPSLERETRNSYNDCDKTAIITELKNKSSDAPNQDFPYNFCSELIQQKNQEQIIFHLLQEMEEIKDHLKKVEIRNDRVTKKKNDQEVLSVSKSEDEACAEKFNKNEGIKKLQQQFSTLKDKYDKQIEKLEKENQDLKKVLANRPKILLPEINNYDIHPSPISVEALSRDAEIVSMSNNLPMADRDKSILPYSSPENIKVPKNSPNTSFSYAKDMQESSFFKHVSSQTDFECQNRSIQCMTNDVDLIMQIKNFFEVQDLNKRELNNLAPKTENKENLLLQKKKLPRSKLFSDVNDGHQAKHKKFFSEHETQLMATVKGLQVEAVNKDKENRRLKTEIDLLKAQLKRLGRSKSEYPSKLENSKKTQIGTQTIALGTVSQQPYNPEVYEVSRELELENENLKFKIKSLESSFEMLKGKRVQDLQSLHKVHEEEMAKLLSKLETQSALAKHLHSLLINR